MTALYYGIVSSSWAKSDRSGGGCNGKEAHQTLLRSKFIRYFILTREEVRREEARKVNQKRQQSLASRLAT